MKDEEISVEACVMKRMIDERINPNSLDGNYGYEDIVKYTAEEVCKRQGITLTEDFYQGFLCASKLESERRKNEEKSGILPNCLPAHPFHPLNALLDIVDEDPNKFMENIWRNFREIYSLKEPYRERELNILMTLDDMLRGSSIFLDIIVKLDNANKPFWEECYDHYWETRK